MTRIILDTDPGTDDAIALFLALASSEVQLEAITTTHGNVGIDLTTRNALALLELAGREDIPVARGSALPLVRPLVDAALVHGESGLGRLTLPEPATRPMAQHAVDLLIERVLAAPNEITLVAVGPLTNLALAVRREPALARLVKEVVIMGGALRVPGNVTPAAEFNIYADPHAAQVVLLAGWPVRLVALDVTNITSVSREQIAQLAQAGGKIGQAIEQMLRHYFEVFAPTSSRQGFALHDPLALAAAFRPDFITWEPLHVEVELSGTLTLGATVAAYKRPNTPPANVLASMGVDSAGFIAWAWERLLG